MIVQCPTCSTRYRHEPVAGRQPAQAGCSKCDATFPLAPARRRYVLRSPVAVPGMAVQSAPVGAGDPPPFDRIRIPVQQEEHAVAAAVSVPLEQAPVITPGVPESPAPAAPVAAVEPETPVAQWVAPVPAVEPEVPLSPPVMSAPVAAIEPEAPTAQAVAPVPSARRTLGRRRRFAVLCIAAVAGGFLAYTVASLTGRGPLTWTVLGGCLGLLVGRLCLSWIARED